MERITILLPNTIPWKTASKMILGNVIFVAKSGSDDIFAIRVEKTEVKKVASILKKKKVAFSIQE